MSKTLGGEGGGADDDEGEEPEEDAEDSRPLWGDQVGSLCEAVLQSGHCSFLEYDVIRIMKPRPGNPATGRPGCAEIEHSIIEHFKCHSYLR